MCNYAWVFFFTACFCIFYPHLLKSQLPLVTELSLTQKHPFPLMKYSLKYTDMHAVIRFTPLTQTDSVFAYSAGSHIIIHSIYAHVWTAFIPSRGKKMSAAVIEHHVAASHWGGHAGMLLCHRASWAIVWAYQVATRVSGSVWVTECLLILKQECFFPLFLNGAKDGWGMVGYCTVNGEPI